MVLVGFTCPEPKSSLGHKNTQIDNCSSPGLDFRTCSSKLKFLHRNSYTFRRYWLYFGGPCESQGTHGIHGRGASGDAWALWDPWAHGPLGTHAPLGTHGPLGLLVGTHGPLGTQGGGLKEYKKMLTILLILKPLVNAIPLLRFMVF